MNKSELTGFMIILLTVGVMTNLIMVFKAQTDEWKGLFFALFLVFGVEILKRLRELTN